MARDYGTTCRVRVIPRDDLEAGAANFYFGVTLNRIDTTADVEYKDKVLLIRGLGFDGRCSFCRYFRLNLKRRGISVKVDCPFETPGTDGEYRVEIGDRFFDQSYLEDEQIYNSYTQQVKEAPDDAEARLVLGVINEYHGRFVDAISSYWKAYELDNSNSFVRARLKEILEFLIEVLPDS